MATSIYTHLNAPEIARAKSIELFANESRLARKPRCSDTKDCSKIRTVAHALKHPYIQPNSPVAYSRLVFDLDWHNPKHRNHQLPLKYLAAANAWENDLGLPAPSWAAFSRDKNSGHIGYELETPVGRHEHARAKPQQYLAAIESAFATALGADHGFNGQLCKNPINAQWELYEGPRRGRDLGELAEYVDIAGIKAKSFDRTPRGEIGRNVYLFDETRFWAYDNINSYRSGPYELWERAVKQTAEHINTRRYDHLPEIREHGLLPANECKAISKSVAKWVWANHGTRSITAAFSALQAWRGNRGAIASAKVKRERREIQILDAIGALTARGELPTMVKVAALIGCSKSALSMHYKDLFRGTLH